MHKLIIFLLFIILCQLLYANIYTIEGVVGSRLSANELVLKRLYEQRIIIDNTRLLRGNAPLLYPDVRDSEGHVPGEYWRSGGDNGQMNCFVYDENGNRDSKYVYFSDGGNTSEKVVTQCSNAARTHYEAATARNDQTNVMIRKLEAQIATDLANNTLAYNSNIAKYTTDDPYSNTLDDVTKNMPEIARTPITVGAVAKLVSDLSNTLTQIKDTVNDTTLKSVNIKSYTIPDIQPYDGIKSLFTDLNTIQTTQTNIDTKQSNPSPVGPPGPDGNVGSRGNDGPIGQQGENGYAGFNGQTVIGPIGDMGPIGPTGYQGIKGHKSVY